MYQICFANMLQIHISDTIMYTLAEMNVSKMYSIFDTKLTCLVVYTQVIHSLVIRNVIMYNSVYNNVIPTCILFTQCILK